MPRKIVIERCEECPYIDDKMGYVIPFCFKARRLIPNSVLDGDLSGEVAMDKPIPDWCPLPMESE